jgi:sensor histidine kinase YesM
MNECFGNRIIMADTAIMFPNERRLRIIGLVSFFALFYVFYQSLILFYAHEPMGVLIVKTLLVSALFAITMWEPTRWMILKVRASMPRQENTVKRKILVAVLVLSYAVLIGFLRTMLEDRFIWSLPWKEPSFFLPMIGSNVLFLLVEVTLYESYFFVQKWHNSEMEAKELKKLNVQMQYDSLKMQIQPHFLFNTLNALVGLIEVDPKRAVTFTKELAYVYRYLLAAHNSKLISLEQEFLFTQAYIYLIKTRYPDGLNIDIQFEQDQLSPYLVPPLSLQMLVENAIKHNIITRARPLRITMSLDEERRMMTVSNNLQRKEESAKKGTGLSMLKKKFELNNMQGLRVYEDAATFAVTIPLK